MTAAGFVGASIRVRVPQAASTAATGAKPGATGPPLADESSVAADITLTAPLVPVGVAVTGGVTADVATAVAATTRGAGADVVVSASALRARGVGFFVDPVTVFAVVCVFAGLSAAVGAGLVARCLSLLALPGGRLFLPAFAPGFVAPAVSGAAFCAGAEVAPGFAESSAHAVPGVLAIAKPTPSATANPPTRPTYMALFMVGPLVRPE
ncbi:hypothetical protein A5630_14130 [Mycolicibacterium mucogenicum]|uniref:Uncharacterized protein n=1 Tax=Mycolicibacterium mucogenicum TaxID=56689 RepID=A0A1A3HB48_MYCMU|nr:hypothetical protein A5630_14130 [Mycolicibacterium mucogenicum]